MKRNDVQPEKARKEGPAAEHVRQKRRVNNTALAYLPRHSTPTTTTTTYSLHRHNVFTLSISLLNTIVLLIDCIYSFTHCIVSRVVPRCRVSPAFDQLEPYYLYNILRIHATLEGYD